MRHSLRFGIAAVTALFVGGLLFLGVVETPAFAQATAGQAAQSSAARSTAQRASSGATTVSPEIEARRVARRVATWPRSPRELQNGVGGAGGGRVRDTGPGNNPVPLTRRECEGLGGVVVTFPSGDVSCNVRSGSVSRWMSITE